MPLEAHEGKISFPDAAPAELVNRARGCEVELVRCVFWRKYHASWEKHLELIKSGKYPPKPTGPLFIELDVGAGHKLSKTCRNCGGTTRVWNPELGEYVPCDCLVRELNKKKLGFFYCPDPASDTPLSKFVDRDLRIIGNLKAIRRHVTGALLDAAAPGRTFLGTKAYRLIDITSQKDQEFKSLRPLREEIDLLVLALGWGDRRHGYLSELVNYLLGTRRVLWQRATWVVLGASLDQIAKEYSQEIADKVQKFTLINVVSQ